MGAQAPHADYWDENDPARPVPPTVLGKGNPNLVLASTEYGGHLGWWTGGHPQRWLRVPAFEWLSALVEAPEMNEMKLPPNPHTSQGTIVTPVKADVIPISAVRPYVSASVRKAQAHGKKTHDDEAAQSADQAPLTPATEEQNDPATPTKETFKIGNDRLTFLTTPVLDQVELLHPFTHEWYQDSTWGAARREAASANAVLGLELTMVQDKTRPAVGYAELPVSTRVGGVGDEFLAGAEIPGEIAEGKHGVPSQDGVVAGL